MRRFTGWVLSVGLGVALLAVPGVGQDETTDPHEPNDRAEDAAEIGLPFVSESTEIAPAGDRDVYAFTLEQAGRVLIDVDAEVAGSALDAMLVLMALSGQPIAMSDDADGLDPRLERDLEAGRYVLMVRSFNGTSTGRYRLRVASLGEPTCRGGTLVAGASDRWRMGPFPAGSWLRVTLEGPAEADFDLWVYELVSETPLLTAVRGRGVSLSSQESVRVQAGGDTPAVYIVEVHAVEGSGDYELCATSALQEGGTP